MAFESSLNSKREHRKQKYSSVSPGSKSPPNNKVNGCEEQLREMPGRRLFLSGSLGLGFRDGNCQESDLHQNRADENEAAKTFVQAENIILHIIPVPAEVRLEAGFVSHPTPPMQVETRVQRQIILEDGKVIADSGPQVTTKTTEDNKTEETENTEVMTF